MTAIVEIVELGRRIRRLRLEHRLTLKQVEEASGLSATHLSEIERGRTSPTIGALVRIARALEKDAAYFIEGEERAEIAHLLREKVRRVPAGAGITAESLTPGIPGSRVFAYRLLLRGAPRAEFGSKAQEVPGEAIYLVWRGQVEAEFGETRATLGTGDAAQASLRVAHRMRAGGGQDAEVIAVLTRSLDDTP